MRKAKTCVLLHAILLAPSRWLANDVTSNDRKIGLRYISASDLGGEKARLVIRLSAADLADESMRSLSDLVLATLVAKT